MSNKFIEIKFFFDTIYLLKHYRLHININHAKLILFKPNYKCISQFKSFYQ